MRKRLTLVDVRGKDEYAKGHILGSVNVPLSTLKDNIYDVVPDLDNPVFVYCLSGKRSVQAAYTLRDMGYDNAVSIGGISDYKGDLD